jgi:Predicted signal transduction protein with a C-terminal ATPase domain
MLLLIVYIVTWLVLSIFLFQPLQREREQNMMYNSEKIVNDIRNTRENYDNIMFRLSNNHIIYKSLSDKCKNYEAVWEALTSIKYTLSEDMARSSIIKILQVYQQKSDIGQDGRYVFCDGFDRAKLQNTNWVNETIDGTPLLCKYQRVSSLYNKVEAYIKIAIESQDTFGGVMQLDRDMSGIVYLTNENNKVIASSELGSLGTNIRTVLPENVTSYINGEIKENNKTMIIKSTVDENWNLWLVAPSNQFATQINNSKVIVGIILLGYGICSAMVLSILLSKVFKRLHKLGEKMEQIQGDISYITIPEKYDEVTVLENKYNSMLKKLDNVIDEMADVKSQKQKFEFKSLESQINPHFLYNTLGVMRWEALECQNQKLAVMIDDLTTFYRLSLNKGHGLLTVEQELKLVKAYINIQQIRWDNVVDVTISMDSELKEVIIPKMILQPLVENIWLHGNITAEGNCKIEISVKNSDSYIVFHIWDNGDGIPEDIIEKFNVKKDMNTDSFGIGIQFIRNILNFYYGDNFIYEITSKKQLGTLVRIELPKQIGVIV